MKGNNFIPRKQYQLRKQENNFGKHSISFLFAYSRTIKQEKGRALYKLKNINQGS